jgi:hypothetical protein
VRAMRVRHHRRRGDRRSRGRRKRAQCERKQHSQALNVLQLIVTHLTACVCTAALILQSAQTPQNRSTHNTNVFKNDAKVGKLYSGLSAHARTGRRHN